MGVSTIGTKFLHSLIGWPSLSLSSLGIGPSAFPKKKKEGLNIGLGVTGIVIISCLGSPGETISSLVRTAEDGPGMGIGAVISISTHLAIGLISSYSSSPSDES